ncbi:MAG TPA: hypothetical protein DCG75_15100 [Bacteroidales bacterium]|jgi:hypothetical protein|nr:hypothetical protein [Bacteroidales bacterium]
MEKWIIKINVFESKEQNDKLMLVIKDIIEEFERLIPGGPPLGYKSIELINDQISGPAFYWPVGMDFYKIALNISDLNYNQVAFQFTQELGRIYCDPRMKSWFIQLLSHVVALYSLNFLGQKWEKDPPNSELKDYWYNFDSYKSNLLAAAFSKVDIVKYQVANEWVQYQVNKLRRKDKINRGKLLIIAFELLPMFMEHSESWQILPYVGKCSVPPPPVNSNEILVDRETEPDFDLLLKQIPTSLKTFANLFYEKIGAREYI